VHRNSIKQGLSTAGYPALPHLKAEKSQPLRRDFSEAKEQFWPGAFPYATDNRKSYEHQFKENKRNDVAEVGQPTVLTLLSLL